MIEPFLAEHVVLSAAAAILMHQLGIPLPAFPVLIWAGSVTFADPLQLFLVFLATTLAGTLGNLPWYWAGRRYGHRVLGLVCRVTLSPASCVRQTESTFERRGPAMLVVARFLPGAETLAPPLAGALRLEISAFLLYDLAGSALRAAAGLALGLAFHDQVGWLLEWLAQVGVHAMLLIGALLVGYVAYRFAQSWLFLRSLRTARISVQELSGMMNRGDDPIVLDVRTYSNRLADGRRIPGARAVDLDALEATLSDVPREREVVVYCACPNEATAATVALRLRARGFGRVRPLAGGIDAWVSAGLAVDSVAPQA